MTLDHGKLIETLKADFGLAGVASMDMNNSNVHFSQPAALDLQTVTKCHGDYNRIPYGWTLSPFMGKCGFKIQLKNFFSASSPCYPIQDISCLGPTEKKAWSHICATEFPCKRFSVKPVFPDVDKPSQGIPDPKSISTGSFEMINRLLHEYLPVLIGTSFAACLLSAYASSEDDSSESSSVWYEMGYVFNWRAFYIQRQKVYNVVWRSFVTLGIGSIIYVGSMCVIVWNDAVQRMWLHYVKKERERAELMDLIRDARELGKLPPSDFDEFQ